jgi:hypothetical protein
MLHKFSYFVPLPNNYRYSFAWNDETGELSGKDADEIKDFVLSAVEYSRIVCKDINGDIPAIDPLKNKAEFCALIGLDNLPVELKPYYPTPDYPGFEGFESAIPGTIKPEINIVY